MEKGATFDITRLVDRLEFLYRHALQFEQQFTEQLHQISPAFLPGARNLLHYLAVRQHDLQELQLELHERGLSSLGRMEAYVLPTLDAVLTTLRKIAELPPTPLADTTIGYDFKRCRANLEAHAADLLGAASGKRRERIMVTVDLEQAQQIEYLEQLVNNGMNIMRINCSRGDESSWLSAIRNLRSACELTGTSCRTVCDIPGPNPRTLFSIRKTPGQADERLYIKPGDVITIIESALPPEVLCGELVGGKVTIACTLPAALFQVSCGDPVAFDDGKIRGHVTKKYSNGIDVLIDRSNRGIASIRSGKSINFPGSELDLPMLDEADLRILNFAASHADMVALSFIRSAEDLQTVVSELRRARNRQPGIILKIETAKAFNNLPDILLAALASPPVGVMVARGDLGVEVGFERLAELQEEILWLCEAAHVPAIWATQVLENLAKRGIPSRGEVTDAAMSVRAECVMLNKGRHLPEAIQFLGAVLERMQSHQKKRFPTLRKLKIASKQSCS